MAMEYDLQIRLATQEDAETISVLNMDVQRIHAEAFPHIFKPPSIEAFPAWMIREWLANPDNFIYLGYLEGQAIGYVFAEVRRQLETSSKYALDSVYIHQMSLKPEYQSRGYGSKLMEAVKHLAKEKGISTIALDVWTFNTQARAFYQKLGFVNYNERMWLELTDL